MPAAKPIERTGEWWLSPTDREVMAKLAAGFRVNEITRLRGVTPSSISNTVRKIISHGVDVPGYQMRKHRTDKRLVSSNTTASPARKNVEVPGKTKGTDR